MKALSFKFWMTVICCIFMSLTSGMSANAVPLLDLALCRAAERGQLGKVQELVSRGASVNARDEDSETALIDAAYGDFTNGTREFGMLGNAISGSGGSLTSPRPRQRAEIIEFLIHRKANPNLADLEGKTPLMVSVVDGDPRVVQALISGGAKINSKEKDGYSALMFSVFSTPNIVRLLLNHGADPNSKNKDGITILEVAAMFAPPSVVRLLISRGAKVGAHDPALAQAEKLGREKNVAVLKHAGAKD